MNCHYPSKIYFVVVIVNIVSLQLEDTLFVVEEYVLASVYRLLQVELIVTETIAQNPIVCLTTCLGTDIGLYCNCSLPYISEKGVGCCFKTGSSPVYGHKLWVKCFSGIFLITDCFNQ